MGLLAAPAVFSIDSMNRICKYEEKCQLSPLPNIYFHITEQLELAVMARLDPVFLSGFDNLEIQSLGFISVVVPFIMY